MPDLRFADGDVLSTAQDHLTLGDLPGFLIFGGTANQVRQLTETLTRQAGRPLLFSADLERGAGQQFEGLSWLPPNMAIAATGREQLAHQAGLWTAREACTLGVRLIFAPVADVHTHPENPIIGARAFGSDPQLVGQMTAAYCRGVLDGGGLPCGKHFPGHGSTAIDSHVHLSRAEELDPSIFARRHLRPFEKLICAGVMPALMTAHVAVPLDPAGVPATWSAPILTHLLRDRLGYEGAVLSDALLMGAMDTVGPGQAAWRSLLAGVDILLAPSDPAETLREMAADPSDATARVQQATQRVARLTALQVELERDHQGEVDRTATQALARQICRESITLLDPRQLFRPITANSELLLVSQQPDLGRISTLLECLPLAASCQALQDLGPPPDTMRPTLVVFDSSIGAWQPSPFRPSDYRDRLRAWQRAGATLLILDHPGPARDLSKNGPVLLSYGAHPEQQRAVAAVLDGRSTAHGAFPGTEAD